MVLDEPTEDYPLSFDMTLNYASEEAMKAFVVHLSEEPAGWEHVFTALVRSTMVTSEEDLEFTMEGNGSVRINLEMISDPDARAVAYPMTVTARYEAGPSPEESVDITAKVPPEYRFEWVYEGVVVTSPGVTEFKLPKILLNPLNSEKTWRMSGFSIRNKGNVDVGLVVEGRSEYLAEPWEYVRRYETTLDVTTTPKYGKAMWSSEQPINLSIHADSDTKDGDYVVEVTAAWIGGLSALNRTIVIPVKVIRSNMYITYPDIEPGRGVLDYENGYVFVIEGIELKASFSVLNKRLETLEGVKVYLYDWTPEGDRRELFSDTVDLAAEERRYFNITFSVHGDGDHRLQAVVWDSSMDDADSYESDIILIVEPGVYSNFPYWLIVVAVVLAIASYLFLGEWFRRRRARQGR